MPATDRQTGCLIFGTPSQDEPGNLPLLVATDEEEEDMLWMMMRWTKSSWSHNEEDWGAPPQRQRHTRKIPPSISPPRKKAKGKGNSKGKSGHDGWLVEVGATQAHAMEREGEWSQGVGTREPKGALERTGVYWGLLGYLPPPTPTIGHGH